MPMTFTPRPANEGQKPVFHQDSEENNLTLLIFQFSCYGNVGCVGPHRFGLGGGDYAGI